ncbi:Uncharacterized protein TPAR_07997 [Tolypocladium paradoxum]|uniref:SP-RING-type domain-containing protein n=1 Tax=Tolypocladium paradoxum TaxID=94208 RepID=A0A2S4KNK9_9HYPO|nr:Uncharacterized protein TPAR_07997 [Tolypocladium paradoxum]
MPPPTKKSKPRAGPASSISTTNETSFAFLGARRPSWMTGGAPTTPDDHGSTRADARTTRRAKQPTKPSADHHAPPSGSVVPVDAHREPARLPNDTASSGAVVLPSPALSSEPSSAASTPAPAENTSCANSSAVTAQQASASTAGGALPTTSQAAIPSSASGDVEPVGATSLPIAKEPTQATSQTGQGTQTSTTPGPHAPESSVPTDLPTPPRPRTLEPSATSSAATKRAAPAPEASQGENSARGDAGDEVSDGRRKRSRTEDGSHRAVSSPGSPSVKPLLEDWLRRIELRLHLYPDPEFPKPLERVRYKLLCDACLKADPFYIVLHQLFCLWSIKRECAYALLEPDRHVVDSGFELLLCALRNNSELSAAQLLWFASFPLDVDGATGAIYCHQTYSNIFLQINTFLRHFATGWGQLLVKINSRRYPLMIWESKDALKCMSPVLQEILFTSSRRRLAGDDNAPVHELQRVFSLDRKNESRTVDSSERVMVRDSLAERYKALIQQSGVDSGRPGHSSTPTTAPNPAPGLVRSSSGAPGTPMAPYRSQPAHQTQSPVIPQHQAPNAVRLQPTSPHLDSHRDDSRRPSGPTVESRFVLRSSTGAEGTEMPRPTPGPTAVMGASSATALAQQLAAWQPALPRATGARQLAAFPSTLVRPDQVASRAAPHPLQTWQSMQHVPGQALQYLSPDAWAGAQGVQQHSSPLTPYPLGVQQHSGPLTPYPLGVQPQSGPVTRYPFGWNAPHPQQTAPVAQQPMQLWSNNAFQPNQGPIIHNYSPPTQPVVPALPEQTRPRPAASLTQSQHDVAPIPETEYPQNEHDWSSVRHSLHLVYLRSPRRVPPEPYGTRYYQFVSHFAVEPKAVLAQAGLRILEFCVSQEDLSRVVRTSDSCTLPTAPYCSGSLRYRLRLCRAATPQMKKRDWPISPSFWPPHIFLTFNGEALHPRRRQHFHRDLPVELTGSLKLGKNLVEISLPAAAANLNTTATCFMAVEVVTTLDYATVRSMIVGSKHCSLDETRREIARRLRPIDSDDVIVENDAICVSVADPFSSVLFTTPVRGVACKHIECFDLKIWLDTRRGKPSHGRGEPSLVDDWKCPICGLDARPVSLRIDDYFAEVRQKLVEGGCGGTKKIRIKADGSWTPVQEPDEVEDERRSASQARASPRTERAPTEAAPAPIIILDD